MDAQEADKAKGLKVIGAGFGRTGTSSLQIVLEELGFGPCYHFEEVYKHRDHLAQWEAAARGEPVDWHKIFGKYQAALDWPSCAFYKELMNIYPDAKVLLTVRNPEGWYESAKNSIYQLGTGFKSSPVASAVMKFVKIISPLTRRIFRLSEDIVWEGTFHGRFEDKDYSIAVFQQHIEEVKKYVPPEKLLVYEVKEGWKPLCDFLGVEIPAGKEFFHLNDRTSFRKVVLHGPKKRVFTTSALLAASLLTILLFVFIHHK